MAAGPNALIVEVEGGDGWHKDSIHHLCRELHQRLSTLSGIRLAAPTPVPLDEAYAILARHSEPIIPVLIGNEGRVREAAREIPLTGNARPVLVDFEHGGAALDLSNASQDDIVRLVRAAIEAADAGLPGRPALAAVLELRIPAPPDKQDRDTAPPEAATGPAKLPMLSPDTPRVDVNVRRTLKTVQDWAEAATAVLADLWSARDNPGHPVYGLSWSELMDSLDRLLGIAEAPMEEARRRYEAVKGMLGHESAAQTPFVRMAELLGRDEVALKLLMTVLAPELDIRFQRMFGALHDDMGRRHASLGLACAIVAAATEGATPRGIRAQISALATLRELRLIEGMGDTLPAADDPLRVDRRLLDWLVSGKEEWLTADSAFDAILRPTPAEATALLPSGRRAELDAAVRSIGNRGQFDALILSGSEAGWIEAEAAAIAVSEIRIGPPAAELPVDMLDGLIRQAIRATRLLSCALVVDLVEPSPHEETFWRTLSPLLRLCDGPAWVVAPNPARLLAMADGPIGVVALPAVEHHHRLAAIAELVEPGAEATPALAAELAERFRLPLTLLPDVRPLARAAAAKARRESAGAEEWQAALRNLAGAELPSLARRVPPVPAAGAGRPLDRVVLPERQQNLLETLVSHVQVGGKVLRDWAFGHLLEARGVSALFAGESGTGKTTAAHAIASELGADLYVIDLAKIVSKYIGETEKNLHTAFTEAERAGAVLLFDEAEALFGRRSLVKDAHDRYANIEVAYLLQRIELFDGLAILTTNHPKNIDQAFGRRLRFTIDFPFPGVRERELIWKRTLPQDSGHVGGDVDFSIAARRLEVTGGSIRQIVLHALMDAAAEEDGLVRPRHLQDAARTELTRLGRHDHLAFLDTLFVQPLGRAA